MREPSVHLTLPPPGKISANPGWSVWVYPWAGTEWKGDRLASYCLKKRWDSKPKHKVVLDQCKTGWQKPPHTPRKPVTPDRSVEEVTATIVTLSCILLLVILALISPQVFQSWWNIRKQKRHVAGEGGLRSTDLQRPGK